jgi:hypothetical protein
LGLNRARGLALPYNMEFLSMPTFDATFVGKLILPEVSTGPVPPGPGTPSVPPGYWGGGNVPMPTPPIYIPIEPPATDGAPTHPIYIPVWPTHPIELPPQEPGGPPVLWPPVIWGGPGGLPPMIGGGPIMPPSGPPATPTHPIYIPVYPAHPIELPPGTPPSDVKPEHPIYFPVYPAHPIAPGGAPPVPTHPIVLPPPLPPGQVSPPAGAPGFWGYSVYYGSPVFVPYAGGSSPPAPDHTLPTGRRS